MHPRLLLEVSGQLLGRRRNRHGDLGDVAHRHDGAVGQLVRAADFHIATRHGEHDAVQLDAEIAAGLRGLRKRAHGGLPLGAERARWVFARHQVGARKHGEPRVVDAELGAFGKRQRNGLHRFAVGRLALPRDARLDAAENVASRVAVRTRRALHRVERVGSCRQAARRHHGYQNRRKQQVYRTPHPRTRLFEVHFIPIVCR